MCHLFTNPLPFYTLALIKMGKEREPSQPKAISHDQAHEMQRDKVIISLQDHVRKLIIELEQVKGSIC